MAEVESISGGNGWTSPDSGDGALSRLVDDDAAWSALVTQLDAAHDRMNELTMLRMDRAPADIGMRLQKARDELNDAEQAMLSFVAAVRRAKQIRT